jgi:hypothetical protein
VSAVRVWSTLIGPAGSGVGCCFQEVHAHRARKDTSHLKLTNNEGSWPAPYRNISVLVTLYDFSDILLKYECKQWFFTGTAEFLIN